MSSILIAKEKQKNGFEVWGVWDVTAQVWELFASQEADDYIGCVDSIKEAEEFARDYFAENKDR